MKWSTIERPGYAGKIKNERRVRWNKEYGEGNWRIAWIWNGNIVDRSFAYQLYEEGYYTDSFNREDIWKELLKTARDVYDIEKRDVESGLDYLIQEGIATHLQDISVRRVVQRRGWTFEGNELIRVREHNESWGNLFSPGRIQFHLTDLIEEPHLESWWDYNTIEDFYQSNKVLQVLDEN